MGTSTQIRPVQPGDVVRISGRQVGDRGRTGQIVTVLGGDDHPHYLIRWDDGHESILYPGEGVTFEPRFDGVASAD